MMSDDGPIRPRPMIASLVIFRRHVFIIRQLTRIRLLPIVRTFTVFFVKRSGKKQQHLVLITLITILIVFMASGPSSVRTLYLYGHPFCMDAVNVSLLLSSQSILAFALSLIAACVKKKLDNTFLLPILGLIAVASEFVLLGLARTIWPLYIGVNDFLRHSISIHLYIAFFFDSLSRLYWKPIFYYDARFANQTDQSGRDERIRHRVHRCKHHRDDRYPCNWSRSQRHLQSVTSFLPRTRLHSVCTHRHLSLGYYGVCFFEPLGLVSTFS